MKLVGLDLGSFLGWFWLWVGLGDWGFGVLGGLRWVVYLP